MGNWQNDKLKEGKWWKKLDNSSGNLTLEEAFFNINKSLCETYNALNPLALLDYPAEDVFNLINGTIKYNERNKKKNSTTRDGVVRRKANDNWF